MIWWISKVMLTAALIFLENAVCHFKTHYRLRCIFNNMLSTVSWSRSWTKAFSMCRTCSCSTRTNQSWISRVWKPDLHMVRRTITLHNNLSILVIKGGFSHLALSSCHHQRIKT